MQEQTKSLVTIAIGAMLSVVVVSAVMTSRAHAALPDGRGYELVSPVEKNGLSPYGAVSAPSGGAVDFQARGALGGALSGSLNLYRATRSAAGWQTVALTPKPSTSLGALEEQVPVWYSSDLSQTIFTTPQSYDAGDADKGALSLYRQTAGELTLLSRGTQGGNEPREVTFDGATPDGSSVVFSTGASLLPAAIGNATDAAPEAEYLYDRDVATGQTNIVNTSNGGQLVSAANSTLASEAVAGANAIQVIFSEGFFPGQTITVGAGNTAETAQIFHVTAEGAVERLGLVDSLSNAHPKGSLVTHAPEGAILGDGSHLTSGLPPAGEYLPSDTESGSTTNAMSTDGSKLFFESPSPARGQPVGLYVREDNSTTRKIAGARKYGSIIAEFSAEERSLFGSARYEGAAASGALVFFSSEEGLAGMANGKELYEYNTTEHEVGSVPPQSVGALSAGSGGDHAPVTTLAVAAKFPEETITVASTAGFTAGEAIAYGEYEISFGRHSSGNTATIASVTSATELTLTSAVIGAGQSGIPVGTVVHGVHPASMTAVSNDGSHVYFISSGVLAANANAEGAAAIPVKPNLYVFDTRSGATTFIGTMAEGDVEILEGTPTGLIGEPDISRPAIPTSDGNVLVFASAANLTRQNPWQEFTEIYRYSVTGNELECLSCTAPGIKPTGNANFGETAGGTYDPPGLTSPISEDGSRVFFDTPDSLVPEDTNGNAPLSAKFGTPTSTDVYEAEGGNVFLLSSGKFTNPSVLQGTTPSGDDVLFTTSAVMAPQDTDGGYENVWDARVGGGFPAAAGGAPSCTGANCRSAFGVAPVFSAPSSTSPQSPGNAPLAKPTHSVRPVVCRKGFVKKRKGTKVVCARKRAKKAGHASKTTGRGARR